MVIFVWVPYFAFEIKSKSRHICRNCVVMINEIQEDLAVITDIWPEMISFLKNL